ncbi:hypothetical protein AB0H00_18125 [Nocardia sp. NPDC023852]
MHRAQFADAASTPTRRVTVTDVRAVARLSRGQFCLDAVVTDPRRTELA